MAIATCGLSKITACFSFSTTKRTKCSVTSMEMCGEYLLYGIFFTVRRCSASKERKNSSEGWSGTMARDEIWSLGVSFSGGLQNRAGLYRYLSAFYACDMFCVRTCFWHRGESLCLNFFNTSQIHTLSWFMSALFLLQVSFVRFCFYFPLVFGFITWSTMP